MIKLTRLDGSDIFLNPDLIETIEETPDTHLTLTNGNRYLVLERAWMIVDKIGAFKARIIRRADRNRSEKYLKRRMVDSYRLTCRYDRDGQE